MKEGDKMEDNRRHRTQSIVFTFTAEDIIKEYMKEKQCTFNRAVNELVEKCKKTI